jgi:hypothetical protein
MDGVVKNESFQPINVGYPDAFKKMMIDDQGDAIKMKKLPGADALTYEENILKADELLKEKKYSEAKGLYQKALELKPTESYPKTQVEKIVTILSEIEELHRKNFTK